MQTQLPAQQSYTEMKHLEIVGQGFHSVVVKTSPDTVRKYHKTNQMWQNELDSLAQINKIWGPHIGCAIPQAHCSGTCEQTFDNTTYYYWTDMDLIEGKTVDEILPQTTPHEQKKIGKNLGTVLHNMHNSPAEHTPNRTGTDPLLQRLFDYKLTFIHRVEPDTATVTLANETAMYLAQRKPEILEQGTLGHTDLNLGNIIVNSNQEIVGLIDWSDCANINPSLSIYQLAKEPIWPHISEQYENLGSTIRYDITYAATVMHLIWANTYWTAKGVTTNRDQNLEKLEIARELFNTHTT